MGSMTKVVEMWVMIFMWLAFMEVLVKIINRVYTLCVVVVPSLSNAILIAQIW